IGVAQREARRVGTISFVVPALDDSLRARMHLRLRDRDGRIVARNIQYLSFFPSAYFRSQKPRDRIWIYDPFGLWDLESRLREAGYDVTTTLDPENPVAYGICCRIDRTVADFIDAGGAALFLVHSGEDAECDV